ncbi:MAG: hypothetical protein KDN22_33470 [Verrucomicrobiae bacterium]|nr:hypothetical protein [Verrucomicrobiae bacterium]
MSQASLAFAASAIALTLFTGCQSTSSPLLPSKDAVLPTMVGSSDLLQFECTFFTAPDDFELLKNTKKNHIAGVFSPIEGERLIRQLKRRREFELMSAPSVTARQGEQARIEQIREFIYPTEFDPPKTQGPAPSDSSSFAATPTTPTKFDKKDIGIKSFFNGRRNAKGGIDVMFDFEQVNLLGFVNYGSPISTTGRGRLGMQVSVMLTENRIEQPVFAEKRLASAVTLPNGHYLAVGGLRSDSQKSLAQRMTPGQIESDPKLESDGNLFALIKVTAVKP